MYNSINVYCRYVNIKICAERNKSYRLAIANNLSIIIILLTDHNSYMAQYKLINLFIMNKVKSFDELHISRIKKGDYVQVLRTACTTFEQDLWTDEMDHTISCIYKVLYKSDKWVKLNNGYIYPHTVLAPVIYNPIINNNKIVICDTLINRMCPFNHFKYLLNPYRQVLGQNYGESDIMIKEAKNNIIIPIIGNDNNTVKGQTSSDYYYYPPYGIIACDEDGYLINQYNGEYLTNTITNRIRKHTTFKVLVVDDKLTLGNMIIKPKGIRVSDKSIITNKFKFKTISYAKP